MDSDPLLVALFYREPILLLIVPDSGQALGEHDIAREIDRLQRFRSTGIHNRFNIVAHMLSDALRVGDLLTKTRPIVVHVRRLGTDATVPLGLVAVAGQLPAEALASVRCLVLEDCDSPDAAEELAEFFPAVVGINGPFADAFLGTFYARLRSDTPIYDLFGAAHWSFFNHYTETKDAPTSHRPYYLTGDTSALSVGQAGLTSHLPGKGVLGGSAPKAVPDQQAVAYPLFYGTSRAPVDPNDATKGYSGERDEILHYGKCTVLVPRFHDIGSLGSPWWKNLFRDTPDKRLRLDRSSLRELAEDEYWREIRVATRKLPLDSSGALVYIHGYNMTFELAALRAAQLGTDLKVTGAMCFFSWPSKGKRRKYLVDGVTIETSEPALSQYLRGLVQQVGPGRVHILAHSMGNRLFLRSIVDLLARVAKREEIQLGQVILAAADVDSMKFRQLAPHCTRIGTHTTMYVSARDLALALSGIIGDYPRAGFTPPITVVDGLDTVEVTDIDLSLLGHGYFADARDVLRDIHQLLTHYAPPDQRFGLEAVPTPERHWRVRG